MEDSDEDVVKILEREKLQRRVRYTLLILAACAVIVFVDNLVNKG